jgi:hypothetical protein
MVNVGKVGSVALSPGRLLFPYLWPECSIDLKILPARLALYVDVELAGPEVLGYLNG